MSDNRSLQKSSGRQAGAIMTPSGPAVIQVIDIPGGGGALGPATAFPGHTPRKVGGINVLGAILRRWWLVLLVTVMIGGAGIYAGNNFVKPVYVAHAKISWIDRSGSPDGQGTARLIAQATDVLTSRDIPLMVAADPDIQALWPNLVAGRDLKDPAVQAQVLKVFRDIAIADSTKAFQTVDLQVSRKDPVEASRIANAFARAFVKWCEEQITGDIKGQIGQLEQNAKDTRTLKLALSAEKTRLLVDNNITQQELMQAAAQSNVSKMMDEQLAAEVNLRAAQAKLKQLESNGERPDLKLMAIDMIEKEKAADNVLMTYNQQLIQAIGVLEQEKLVKTPQHNDVINAGNQVNRIKALVLQREAEISSIIAKRIDDRFKLMDQTTVAQAKEAAGKAKELLDIYNTRLKDLDERSKKLVYVKGQIAALDDQIALVSRDYDTTYLSLNDAKKLQTTLTNSTGIKIAQYAEPPEAPDQDKRVKVQAAGMVGGLFLGMLLALLVDKFDRRLRDPRDVEPLLGAPLLGTIPRIGELKRMKGEHARNLIAEEFRIIRTQLLFGNPELNHKTIAVTSPQPGDGKTSLAVNLAISIAKAGRRVLLIDGDLRKPDIHRIFNVSDSPGFAEVIAGSHEPGAVIRKSDIDGLDVLPAGTPITRPSELLSRPDVGRVLAAMGEVYDHIVLDTAPLLPVSDTHVLVGLVDGVLTSFNADVDRNTVTLVQDILRRSHANVIGTVMNQVKYKQSGSYHRGKSAYSSYYTSTRVPGAGQLPGKVDPSVATLSKH
jgi:capsular exopolysaccharide synthesis family protein